MPSQETSSWPSPPLANDSHKFRPKITCKDAKPKDGLTDATAVAEPMLFRSKSVSASSKSTGIFGRSLSIYSRYPDSCYDNTEKVSNGSQFMTASFPTKGATTANKSKGPSIRERFADFREQVRVEDLVLSSGTQDDHIKAKDTVGGWAFTPEQMHHLKVTQYEYNASAGSYLELFVMQRFWTWLATFIPSKVAPCSITALGFFINLLTCSILIAYSPDAKSEVPRWSLLLCALGVFLYQIMDALDGKQCYKVQNTQIEEFYDHGCDAVSTILLMYSCAIATQCGQWPALTITVVFASLVAFYSTHWQCYVTDQMVFGKIDVTEAQWSLITIHLLSGIFGQSLWSISMPLLPGIELSLTQILALLSLSSLANAIITNASIVLLGMRTPLDKAGVKIPRRQGANHRVKPVIPVAALSVLAVISYKLGYYHINSTMFVLMFGFTYAKLTMKLVIAHCTKSDFEITDPSLAVPILLVLNQHILSTGPLIALNKALLCALICNTIELVRYFTCVSWDLRVALDVYIFSVRYPPEHAKSRRHCGGYYVNGLNNQEVLKRQQPQE